MGHFTYWRYSRPVSVNFSTRSSPIGDFCSVRSSLGIPVGSRNWRVGSGCSFSPASGCDTMLVPRLLTQQTSEAMHVQGNDGQSNRSSKSLRTFRPNTVEATVFKIVDGRLHSGVLTAHGSKGFTLFAVSISLAEVALLGGGKACNGVPQREGIGDQVGRSLICCRNSFSSSNDGTASRVDLRREDRAGPAAAPPNCPSVPQWVRIER